MSAIKLPNSIEKSTSSTVPTSCGHYACTRLAPHRCGRCKHTHYCSAEHQRADWVQGHQYICDKLSVTQTFAYTEIAQLLKVATDGKNTTVVSVCSGNGCHQAVLSRMYPDIPILCVEPKPESLAAYPTDGTYFKRPDYATASELIRDRPDIVGACVMLLVWTDSRLDYDMEAIEQLSPMSIVVLYDWMGSAGGDRFNRWMDSLGAQKHKKSNESHESTDDDDDDDYVLVPRNVAKRMMDDDDDDDGNFSDIDEVMVPDVLETTKRFSVKRFEISFQRRHTLKLSKFARIHPTLAWVSRVP